MKIFTIALLLSLNVFAEQSPEDLLKKADEIRNPSQDYKMQVEVKTSENEQLLDVYLKGALHTMIVTKKPAKDQGRNMLMVDRDFYAFIPNLKRSMRLSLAQKLSGQVSNGDIARTRWYGDYKVTIASQDKSQIELALTGNKNNLTYQNIHLWIEKQTSRPIKANYLSIDGKTLLKKAFFENYKELLGAERPTLIRIEDVSGQKSSIEIKTMDNKTQSDSFFTEQNMETLR